MNDNSKYKRGDIIFLFIKEPNTTNFQDYYIEDFDAVKNQVKFRGFQDNQIRYDSPQNLDNLFAFRSKVPR